MNSKFRRSFGEYIGRDIGSKIGEFCVEKFGKQLIHLVYNR